MPNARTFRQFLREYIDDIIRLVTLAALLGAILSLPNNSSSWILIAAPLFVALLAFTLFLSMNFAVLEYFVERYGEPKSFTVILGGMGLNFAAMGCIFYLVAGVVLKAFRQ